MDDALGVSGRKPIRDLAPDRQNLTERERQVLGALAEGRTSKEIAARLVLSTKTVENHRARILEKLQVANTAAAIGLAYQQGLVDTTNQP